jgi:hypothetical protein
MKKYFHLITFMFFSLSGFSQISPENYWQDAQKPTTIKQQNSAPANARVLKLNQPALKNELRSLREAPRGQKMMLSIPLPNSGMETFEVEFFPIMSEVLSKKFPEINSYKGVSINDPNKTIAFGFTQKGFHAQILGGQTILIDPISRNEMSDYYQVYFKRDTPLNKNFFCEFESDPTFKDRLNGSIPERDLGDCQIRTFRLALACTGEYALFHGGTVADAMAAINVTMTRVNGIYNRELAVHMTLINNNDEIIYLDGSTDPYTNNNGNDMLDENQDNIDDVIGKDNYDIGHVFSTGGGGVAVLNSPCDNSIKAHGVTGLTSPIGDVFDVDYVSHEMGHQFGANHTQNNNCQRNGATAVEPGSASTIMGYAGICAPNVQGNSDDYFHTISIEEMYDNITGGSSTCGSLINSSNSNPTANAGINRTIPRSTPFFLTGEASAASSFSWEQIDNEVGAMPPATTNTQGPMFRSLQPQASETRFFPNLPSVLNNTTPTWEVLPSVGRAMDFAFTVRDNRFGWGCHAVDEMRVTTAGGAGPFVVTSQSASNQTWAEGTTQTVTWNVANTDTAPVSCEKVDILLSTDGGFTWDIVLSGATANDGTEDIVVPGNITSNGRIIVRCSDNIFYNVSQGIVTITPPCDITDSPNFEMNVICDDGTWKVSVQALDLDPQNHWWGLYQTDTQGEVSDANTVAGPLGGIQNGETANFNWLDQSKRYYIKHRISTDDCYTWRELRIAIEPFYVEPADFILEDENDETKDTFCIGEDIWADGNATIGEGRYNIHAWRVVNGQKQWFGSIGWFSGNMTEVNITEEFATLTNPKYFTEGEYILTIAFANFDGCKVWTPVEKSFKVTCCDDFIKANFFLDPDHIDNETFNLTAINYDTYNSSFQHEWYVLSSPNLTGGPYTSESYQIAENFSYDAAYGTCYFVIHKVISECGEVCYGRSICQNPGLANPKGNCEVCSEISCDILDQWWPLCSATTAPTNVQVSGNTISWDPVPGATGYIIESTNFWPSSCQCGNPISIQSIETTETNVTTSIGKEGCAVVQVRAICGDNSTSQPSDSVCIGGEKLAVGQIDDVHVSPNPNNGEMNFKVTTSETIPVIVEVRNFSGILLYNTTIESKANVTQSVKWNGRAILSEGLYFVTFRTDNEIITKKVIVK